MSSIYINFNTFWFITCVTITLGCSSATTHSEKKESSPAPDIQPMIADRVKPSSQQLSYQQMEMIGFAHFTVNTFTDQEWGLGTESPSVFNPTKLDARQWVQVCKQVGIKQLILTAKHHDGFCLWPSKYTEHSIKNSPWKRGKGDLVKEVSDACREEGIKFGIYLSPWDRHEPKYGTADYNEFYKNQLRELLTNYGEISEVWMDGAKGEEAKDMVYDFQGYWQLVKELQPNAVLFSDKGPDIRWIGNENGFAGETNWSKIDTAQVEIGKADTKYLNTGDPEGENWVAGECDVSIRPGWFYHAQENNQLKSVEQLLDIYYKSVGRNGVLLLNIPPDKRGLFHENDIARLKEFKSVLDETFQTNLATGNKVEVTNSRKGFPATNLIDNKMDTYWATDDTISLASVIMNLQKPTTFDRVLLGEGIEYGQRIHNFTFQIWKKGKWETLVKGTTIGYKRLLRIDETTTDKIKITLSTTGKPIVLSEIGLYKASPKENIEHSK